LQGPFPAVICMPIVGDQYDFFVSYARKDNRDGWIARFLEQLQDEHRKYSGGRSFRIFFDTDEIRSLDDWRHRIYEGLAASRLLVAFISPSYLASEWCRREWRTWIDVEISKHVLSDGAAPIYIVEVPWLTSVMTDQQVADELAKLSQRSVDPVLVRDAVGVAEQLAQRQLTVVRPFFKAGLDALRQDDLLNVLAELAKNLFVRSEYVDAAARSRSTIPPYNRRFVGRLDELTTLRERLHQGRTGVISGHKRGVEREQSAVTAIHGLGGIGKSELAFTYAHAFAGLYPGGRFLVPCEGCTDIRRAMLVLDEVFPVDQSQRANLELHFAEIRNCLRRQLLESGRILLVLDNVTERIILEPEQTDFVRTLGTDLHLLATTRLAAPETVSDDDLHWITLGELSVEDSLRLLEKFRPFDTAEEEAAAEAIAQRLGGFALCVEVVGAHLSQHPEQTYAAFLETMGLADLEQVDQAASSADVITRRHNNEKRLGTILGITLKPLSEKELVVLKLAALLPPDDVALPWLRAIMAPRYSAPAEDRGVWNQIARNLMSLALLTRPDEASADALDELQLPRVLRCHRLVQNHLRSITPGDEQSMLRSGIYDLLRQILRGEACGFNYHGMDCEDWEIQPVLATIRAMAAQDSAIASHLIDIVDYEWEGVKMPAPAMFDLYDLQLKLSESWGLYDRMIFYCFKYCLYEQPTTEIYLRRALAYTERTYVDSKPPENVQEMIQKAAEYAETLRFPDLAAQLRRFVSAGSVPESASKGDAAHVGVSAHGETSKISTEQSEAARRQELAVQGKGLCRYCGAEFYRIWPGKCSYHPNAPVDLGGAGPLHDYCNVYRFDCCGKVVFADDPPPCIPGCKKRKHEA